MAHLGQLLQRSCHGSWHLKMSFAFRSCRNKPVRVATVLWFRVGVYIFPCLRLPQRMTVHKHRAPAEMFEAKEPGCRA